ncbi:hypothetical protein [Mobilicoccus pelagius]|uniref:hypothetical protein n=1 Tax=Mobilicoccus pelagius TaxID=746032 RepID=UPI0005902BCB|nr:hypothetical protein [Mobilicoccus pelagius]
MDRHLPAGVRHVGPRVRPLADLTAATGSVATHLDTTLTAAEVRTLACDAEVLPAVLGGRG